MQTKLFDELISDIQAIEYKDWAAVDVCKSRAKSLARTFFQSSSKDAFQKEIDGAHFASMVWVSGTPESEEIKDFENGRKKLSVIIENMKREYEYSEDQGKTKKNNGLSDKNFKDIFIVHGRDIEMRGDVERLILKLGINPVILMNEPDRGRTIIEKLEDYSDINHAIVLISPDDVFTPNCDEPETKVRRARQNVILELVFFMGKFSRGNVIPLFRKDKSFEMPSDIHGVIYQTYDPNDRGWKKDIGDELAAMGFEIDFSKL